MSPNVLPNLIALGLVAGLTVFATVRRPPAALWPALRAYNLCALFTIAGYLMTDFLSPPWSEPVGVVMVYAGGLLTAALSWVIAVRYAEAQDRPFPWARGPWVAGPVVIAASLAVLAPFPIFWGLLSLPHLADPSDPHWVWYAFAGAASLPAASSAVLYANLAASSRDKIVRRNAAVMGGGLLLTLSLSIAVVASPDLVNIDPTVYGIAATTVLFLYGSYRTRVFAVLSAALRETILHDPDGVVVVDHEGRWLASNPAATTLLGIGLAVPDRDVLALLANHVTTADGGKIGREDLAVALLHADRDSGGTIGPVQLDGSRWLRISATPIRSRKEHPLAVSLRLHDVTISQRAEAALRNNRDELERQVALRTREIEVAVVSLQTEVDERQLAERKLRKSEERHRAISEVSTDLSFAFRLERDGRLEWDWVSRSVEPLTGYKTSELAPLGWQQIVHPDDLENVFEQRSRLLECRPIEFEFRLLTKNGETRWFEAHVRGARDEPDSTMRAVGAVRDITARRQATEQLRKLEMQKHESERLESLGVLAGGIAHDFNNLLAVIGGNAALAASELSSPEALEKRLERIRSAADYAVALTDQILTYAGKPSLIVSPLDLGNLIASLLDLLRASISSKCRIEMQLCDDLPAIDGDSTQIRQIIMNLVTNASEAFGENEGRILLRTGTMNAHPDYLGDAHGAAARQPGEYVYFEVIDNGRGIDADSRKRIFEPFFSTKFSGRGLGLAAVHGIVQAHGGVIKLTSEPGWGTAFRVLFPKSHQKLVYRSTVTLETGASTAGDAAGATVLVVDDDEAVREIAQAFLERAEFRVLVAGGGIEALELIRDRGDEIDAVVLDLSMPDVDGEQTYRELRRDRPDLPVVLVSGYSEEMAAASFSDTDGAAAFLSKPYMPEVLIERIRAALTR